MDVTETEQEDGAAAEVPVEAETPVTFIPRDFPTAAIGNDNSSPILQSIVPSLILRAIEPPPILQDAGSFPETFVEVPTGTPSSPTFSISPASDLTPSELGGDIGEGSGGRIPVHHGTFYLEDGNVEILCGHTIFRVHSPVVSLSSPKLRDMLSPSTLLNAPMPGGCPRIAATDSADDFAALLKMIYTPG